MNRHDETNKRLAAFCSGDLSAEEIRELEAHLAECGQCRSDLADLVTTMRLLRSTPEEEPPAWLQSRIMAHIRDGQKQKRSWLHRFFFPLHIKLPLEAMALVMVCVTGYYVARNTETELKQPQQETPLSAPAPQQQVMPQPAPPRTETGVTEKANAPAVPSAKTMPALPELPLQQEFRYAPTPAPPAVEQEQQAAPVADRLQNAPAPAPAPAGAGAARSMDAAPEMLKKAKRAEQSNMDAKEAAAPPDWRSYFSNDKVEAFFDRRTKTDRNADVRCVYRKNGVEDYAVTYRFKAWCTSRQMFSLDRSGNEREVPVPPGTLYESTWQMICGTP